MSLEQRLTDAFARVGAEAKSIRALANGKYSLPSGGMPYTDFNIDTQGKLALGFRWEQEMLVQSGVRAAGYGGSVMGIWIPWTISITGIRYEFETATTSGTTTGSIMFNKSQSLDQYGGQLSIPQGSTSQTITSLGSNGLGVTIPGQNRLSFNLTNAGTSGIGKGLYVAMWGVYL